MCFAMTWVWSIWASPPDERSDKAPVAYLERSFDEIERRPVAKMFWQLLENGEPVYPGEAIRTSARGEARLQFMNSPRFIDLESDSLIVITQSSQNEISLDLLDGSVMVNQGTASANADPTMQSPALTLKSGDKKVDLTQATANLSKDSSGKIDLRVLKGKAKIESETGSQEVESGSSEALGAKSEIPVLEVLSPSLDHPFAFNPDSPEPVLFSWKGAPTSSQVQIEMGTTRKSLKSVATTKESQIQIPLTKGKYFFQLIARDPATSQIVSESPIHRLDVAYRKAPVLVSPLPEEKILKATPEQKIEFRWSRADQSLSTLLEISTDAEMKEILLSKSFTEEDQTLESLPDGTYFLRLSSQFGPLSQVRGKVSRFQWSTKPLPPPLSLEWKIGNSSKPFYYLETPAAELKWSASRPEDVHNYRIRLAENEDQIQSPQALISLTKNPAQKVTAPKAGRYIAMVEALDVNDKVLATSPTHPIEIAPLPLIEAPKVLPEDGILQADNQGRLDLKWTAVEGAKEYRVVLFKNSGEEVRSGKFQKNSTALINLLPGDFQLEVSAFDIHGRPSQKLKSRTVRVPASSGLSSPKFRKMKVK